MESSIIRDAEIAAEPVNDSFPHAGKPSHPHRADQSFCTESGNLPESRTSTLFCMRRSFRGCFSTFF
jgi:hypothetical protein